MELIRGIYNLKPHHAGCVLTIGNFDGVHRGHQVVIEKTLAYAKQLKLPAVVMIFEPQPMELFRGDKAPARLSRLRDKYEQLKSLGVDRLLCVRFDTAFSNMAATSFIHDLLVKKLAVKHLIVGDDFQFGKGRQGDFDMLKTESISAGFTVMNTDSFLLDNARISSTYIREALSAGELAGAAEMLGRRYSVSGKVVHGDKLGRTIGVPTANIALHRKVSPIRGVYIASVVYQEHTYYGVCNVGIRPTVNGVKQQLEVHLFNFSHNIYGKHLDVVLHKKLRDEQRFESFDALKQQIERDISDAKHWLETR